MITIEDYNLIRSICSNHINDLLNDSLVELCGDSLCGKVEISQVHKLLDIIYKLDFEIKK